jgi:thiamine kinase-like enzyme
MWPFTTAQLTAGLRRYFADSSLTIKSVNEVPREAAADEGSRPSKIRGLRVEYVAGSMAGGQWRGQTFGVDCLVKEPRGVNRAGLAGGGIREVGVYRSLAAQLPMQTPALIAADSAGSWLVLEAVTADVLPDDWTADDYRRAIRTLADLHERFWSLAEDLSVYPWLARPLANDFEIYVMAAVGAMEKMMVDDHHRLITGSLEVLTSLGQMLTQVEAMAEKLRAAPPTLLHGDYQPANIALQDDDEIVVFDWQLAGVGPGVLDLVTFVNAARWHRADLPVSPDELIALYREEIGARVNARWTDAEWTELTDHALMWRFTQELLGWAANASPAEFQTHADRFHDIWLRPVLDAANRRLRPVLYL